MSFKDKKWNFGSFTELQECILGLKKYGVPE